MLQLNLGTGRFRALWWATGVSSVGDGMVLVAFPLLALTLTRGPAAIAGVAVASRLAALLVALPVGAVVDRIDRRRLAMVVEGVRALTLAAFGTVVLTGHDSLAAIYITAFLLGGTTLAVDVVAAACLPQLVGEDGLVTANARLLTAELTGEELVGQAAGGAAFSAAASLPFICDAVSFVASGVLLAYAVPAGEARAPERSLVSDVLAGVRWLVADRLMRILATVTGCLAGCQAMVFGVLALYVTGPLHLSAAGYGLFVAVAGSGNVIGAVSAGRLHRRVGGGWCILGAGVVAVGGYLAMAATSSALVAVAALTAETAAVIVGNVAIRSLRQATAGSEMQGRAAGAFQILVLGALPLGSLAGGLLAGPLGVRGVLVAAAALQVAVLAALGYRLVSAVRVGTASAGPDR